MGLSTRQVGDSVEITIDGKSYTPDSAEKFQLEQALRGVQGAYPQPDARDRKRFGVPDDDEIGSHRHRPGNSAGPANELAGDHEPVQSPVAFEPDNAVAAGVDGDDALDAGVRKQGEHRASPVATKESSSKSSSSKK